MQLHSPVQLQLFSSGPSRPNPKHISCMLTHSGKVKLLPDLESFDVEIAYRWCGKIRLCLAAWL